MTSDHLLARLRGLIANASEYFDLRWRRLTRRYGWGKARQLVAYKGYSNGQNIWLRGRVLANQISKSSLDDSNWWDNLRASFGRFFSNEVPDAHVMLRSDSHTIQTTTDVEGYYTAALTQSAPATENIVASCTSESADIVGVHEIFNASSEAHLMIISDIDDTVIHTGISDLLQAARLTFLSNAKSRKPLAGAAALYNELTQSVEKSDHSKMSNPIFYLSNSPWNLYDLLDDFLELNNFPAGPLLLRDVGIRAAANKHKPQTLQQLLHRFQDLPVILIGDSGESDALYYAELARNNPERIIAIYIRDVDPEEDSSRDQRVDALRQTSLALNITFERVESSIDIANSLALLKVLDDSAVERIVSGTAKDQERAPLVFGNDA